MEETRAVWGDDLRVPEDFAVTATPYDGRSDIRSGRQPPAATDPQTDRFCQRLGVRVCVYFCNRRVVPCEEIWRGR